MKSKLKFPKLPKKGKTESKKLKLAETKVKGSLKTKLAVFFIVMALIPTICLGIVATQIAGNSVKDEIQEKASIIVDNLTQNIDLFVEQNKNLVSFVASTKTLRSMDETQITPFLYDVAQQNAQILRVYVANIEDGSVFAVPYAVFPEDFNVANEEWYKGALAVKGNYISNVRIDELSGNSIISISNIVLSNTGEPVGVICADVSLVSLTRTVMNMKIGENGFAFITDKDGTVIAHKDYAIVKAHENYSEYDFVKKALTSEKGFITYKSDQGKEYFIAFGNYKLLGWGIFVQQPVSEAFAAVSAITKSVIIISLIVLIVSLALGMFLGNLITKPMQSLLRITQSVTNNDLTQTVTLSDNSEIGALALSFDAMTLNLKKLVQEVIQAAKNLSASASELASGAEQSSLSAQQVAEAIEQIAIGANDQAKKLEEISEVVNELVISNGAVEENVNLTVKSAENMAQKAQESQRKIHQSTNEMDSIKISVDESNNIMKELDARLHEIGNITNIIREIVDQTNLLALNASIEAARAGEHGRGFAVVADEVRKLAEQSGKAAKEISDIVKTIQASSKVAVDSMSKSKREVEEGQELIQDINEHIDTLMAEIDKVTNQAKNISEELTQQYTHIDGIVRMISDISSISQETAAGTEEVSASTEEQTATMENISAAAQDLAKLADNLLALVGKFKV